MTKIPTPSGWMLLRTPQGWLKPEYAAMEANSTEATDVMPVAEYAGFYQTLRQDNTDKAAWYLLVARAVGDGTFADGYTFGIKSETQPVLPVNFRVSFTKWIAIGAATGVGVLLIAVLASRTRRRRR